MKGSKKGIAALTVLLALAVVTAALAASGGGDSTLDARKATGRYQALAVAKHDGYAILKDKQGLTCIAMDDMPGMGPMGAMGVHYVKGAYVADGRIEADDPEALVYAPTAHGLKLAALEYVVLKSAWDAHHTARPRLFGHAFNFTPAGNRFGLPAFYSLHAWIWQANPSGEFAMWNPTVSCARKGG
jgi:hypothetical protein